MRTDRLRRLLSILEGAAGVALLLAPSVVTAPIFGSAVAGAGEAVARIAGAAHVAIAGLLVPSWRPTRGP
jgi:hypothetical protein